MTDPLLALESAGAEEKHAVHAARQPETLAALTALLTGKDGGPVPLVLLSGEVGAGALSLLEAAAWEAAEAGAPARLAPIDLDGYEDGEAPLMSFLDHQIVKRALDEEEHSQRAEELREVALALAPSTAAAVTLSLLLALEEPGHTARAAGLAGADGRDSLSRLVDHLARESGLVLYFADPWLASGPARSFLCEEIGGRPGVVLVFALHPKDRPEDLTGPLGTVRFELAAPPSETAGGLSPLDELLNRQDAQTAGRLQRLLTLGALAGDNVPVDLLFEFLGVTVEEREAALDWLDEELVEEDAHRLLSDYQYGHPSFPFTPTYGFRSAGCRATALGLVSPAQRANSAADFLRHLERSFLPVSRGTVALLARLATEAGLENERRLLLHELSWWIDEGEAGELTRDIAAAVAESRLAANEVLFTVRERRGHWPLHRALALLAGLAEARPAERVAAGALTAEWLFTFGRREEAHAAAKEAAALAGSALPPGDPRITEASFTLGFLSQAVGDFATAEEALTRAADLLAESHGAAHPLAVAIDSHAAEVAAERGDGAHARRLFEGALARSTELSGGVNPAGAVLLARYARLLRRLGDTGAADYHGREAQLLAERLHGPGHPFVAELTALARGER